MDHKSNRNQAVQAVRNAECLRDDYRMYNIVQETFNYLIGAFKKGDGQIMLTNTNMSIGEIVSRHLSIGGYSDEKMKLGTLILNAFIDNHFLILEREPYFTMEEIKTGNTKKTLRLQPYHLELGHRFGDVEPEEKERTGISTTRYPLWEKKFRMVNGVRDSLVKSTVNYINPEAGYIKAINSLERVKWTINPQVADISQQLIKNITDTVIDLTDSEGNVVKFDTKDYRRTSLNKELFGMDLFKDGTPFEPHLGNASTVRTIEEAMNKLNKRLGNLKEGGKVWLKVKEDLVEMQGLFEHHNQSWIAKQLCLATQSKSARDKAILETIHGKAGWKGSDFYLSMFLDFRGRVYARDPYFSYQSSDLARGHLMFTEKKLMTEYGYQWLQIHAANSFNQSYSIKELEGLEWTQVNYVSDLVKDGIPDLSVDKMSLDDRVAWTLEHEELFWEVAGDPLGTKDIWMNAEKPWVFLSLCFEIVSYQVAICSDEEYYSQIPVAIDGSSNGTQHLSAMSKDEVSGKMVGLTKQEKPVDFYIIVAKGIINRNIGSDLGGILANIPMKLIRKGISKRGTMTKAYDAGVNCIADIIYTDCYNAGMTVKYGITKNIAKSLSRDLVDTYNTICSGPVAIKDYLQSLVEYRMRKMGKPSVTWKTPSGFLVVSEKWIMKQRHVNLPFTNKTIMAVYHEKTDIPAVHEIMSGISPNYVHSMDASHMSSVINKLNENGITSFGAIHDSFSVHAEDVEDLLHITKECFVEMYEGDVFASMRNNMVDDGFEGDEPREGSLDLAEVMESDYFFC